MIVTVSKRFRFEASHILPKHPGKCARLHGHSWQLIVSVRGPINPETGFVVDYGALSALVHEHIIDKLDHQHLGFGIMADAETGRSVAVPPFGEDFYPSSENLVVAIARLLQPLLYDCVNKTHLTRVSLAETCMCAATWEERQ